MSLEGFQAYEKAREIMEIVKSDFMKDYKVYKNLIDGKNDKKINPKYLDEKRKKLENSLELYKESLQTVYDINGEVREEVEEVDGLLKKINFLNPLN